MKVKDTSYTLNQEQSLQWHSGKLLLKVILEGTGSMSLTVLFAMLYKYEKYEIKPPPPPPETNLRHRRDGNIKN